MKDKVQKNRFDFQIYGIRRSEPASFDHAIALAREGEDNIPIGIFYRKEKTDFTSRIPALRSGPLLSRSYNSEAVQILIGKAG